MLTKIMADPRVAKALEYLKNDNENVLKETIELASIPAFSHHELEKAERMAEKFRALGLEDVHLDEVWNVFGTLRGTVGKAGGAPEIMLAAHTDTVFPLDTDLTLRVEDGIYYLPGINDDTHGLGDILSIIRAIRDSKIELEGDVVFCANVGEEGLGDLRGVKHIFSKPNDIAAFVSLDTPTVGGIIHRGTGSYRYRVTFTGPGGHSFADFGRPSAIHALGRAVAKIATFEVPDSPKTTFNVGTIDGGTSVNTIAARASFLLDIRSDSPTELPRLEGMMKQYVADAVREENARATREGEVTAEIEQVGRRPAGTQSDDALIVQLTQAACRAVGVTPELRDETSTDANIPIYLGIPALSIGRGGREGGVHTVNEWFDPTDAYIGAQKDFLLLLLMAGVAGVESAKMPARHNENLWTD